MTTTPFILDGRTYNVYVTALTRKFSVLDSGKSGRTQDGSMYREVIGTFYNYDMEVQAKPGCEEELDDLWEVMSSPDVSHVCTFPYGQTTLSQRMYVTSGEQACKRLEASATRWGALKVSFIAMTPKVVPR